MSDYGGDDPDTFEGRLDGITLLIDTLGAEIDTDRRRQRRDTIIRLLDHLADAALDRIETQRERLQ